MNEDDLEKLQQRVWAVRAIPDAYPAGVWSDSEHPTDTADILDWRALARDMATHADNLIAVVRTLARNEDLAQRYRTTLLRIVEEARNFDERGSIPGSGKESEADYIAICQQWIRHIGWLARSALDLSTEDTHAEMHQCRRCGEPIVPGEEFPGIDEPLHSTCV